MLDSYPSDVILGHASLQAKRQARSFYAWLEHAEHMRHAKQVSAPAVASTKLDLGNACTYAWRGFTCCSPPLLLAILFRLLG